MLKVLLIPGFLAITAVAFVDRSLAGPSEPALMIAVGPADPGCSDASEPWLPGSLQIKDRSGSPNDADAELRIKRAQTPSDCVLV